MKRIKKLASILLAVVMVLGMGITAFATGATPPTDNTEDPSNTLAGQGNFTLTIDDQTEGYTYAIYQIFSGDLSIDGDRKTMSNIKWGESVDENKIVNYFSKTDNTGNTVPKTAAEVAESIAISAEESNATNGFDTTEAKNFAANIANCLKGTTSEVDGKNVFTPTAYKEVNTITTGRGYVFEKLPVGYYMVANTSVPSTDGDYTRYMMEIVGDLTAKPKRGTLEDDKYIKVNIPPTTPEGEEGVDYFKVNEAPIGGTVEYNIPVKLPENFADYKSYYLEFSDILSKGLTLTQTTGSNNERAYDIKVQVVNGTILNGKTVTNSEDVKSVMAAVEGKVPAGLTVTTKDVTSNFYKKITVNADEADALKNGGTHIQVWMHDLTKLNPTEKDAEAVVKAGSWVILTYSATLNKDALIGTGNPNYVTIKYSNDPNNSGGGEPEKPEEPNPNNPTGETPEKRVDTYTTELTISKTDEDGNYLPGVEFKLSGAGVNIILVTEEIFTRNDEEGTYWKLKDGTYTQIEPNTNGGADDNSRYYESTTNKYVKTTSVTPKGNIGDTNVEVKGTVNEDGTVTFRGLGAGSYILEETYALPGYNRIDPINFEVIWTGREFITDNDAIEMGQNNTLAATIVNHKGSLLPSTGGIGTTIFYVVGGILVIGAGILLVAKKRMGSK